MLYAETRKVMDSMPGYAWELLQPRIQLEPRGERGYMELRAVKRK